MAVDALLPVHTGEVLRLPSSSMIGTFPLAPRSLPWRLIDHRCIRAIQRAHTHLARTVVDRPDKVCCSIILYLNSSLPRTLCVGLLGMLLSRHKGTTGCHHLCLHHLMLCAHIRPLRTDDPPLMHVRQLGPANQQRQDALHHHPTHTRVSTPCPSASRGGIAVCYLSTSSGNANRGAVVQAPSISINSQCTRVHTRRRGPQVLEALALHRCRLPAHTTGNTGMGVLDHRLDPLLSGLAPGHRRQWHTATNLCADTTRGSTRGKGLPETMNADASQSERWSTRGRCTQTAASPRRSRHVWHAECLHPAPLVTAVLRKARVCRLSPCLGFQSRRTVDDGTPRTRTLRARMAV